MIGEISPPRAIETLDCCQFMEQLESGDVFGGHRPLLVGWEDETFPIDIIQLAETPRKHYKGESSRTHSYVRPRGRCRPECRLDATKSLFHIVNS